MNEYDVIVFGGGVAGLWIGNTLRRARYFAAHYRELARFAYLLTGDRVSAVEAHRLGLVHQVVSGDVLLPAARGLADKIAARPVFAVRETKRALNLHLGNAAEISFDAAIEAEARSFDSPEHLDLTSRWSGRP